MMFISEKLLQSAMQTRALLSQCRDEIVRRVNWFDDETFLFRFYAHMINIVPMTVLPIRHSRHCA